MMDASCTIHYTLYTYITNPIHTYSTYIVRTWWIHHVQYTIHYTCSCPTLRTWWIYHVQYIIHYTRTWLTLHIRTLCIRNLHFTSACITLRKWIHHTRYTIVYIYISPCPTLHIRTLSVQCTVYSAQCTVYSAQCTVYYVQRIVYSVQCTVYSILCTVYSVQWLYTMITVL